MRKPIDDIWIDQIKTSINPGAWTKDVDITYNNQFLWNRANDLVQKDRFGEVVFAVERPNGKIIVVTSKEYPKGVFRVPTGGIHYGEDIVGAVYREVKEELGLQAIIHQLFGILRIHFLHEGKSLPFYSFLFHVKETGGRLLLDATDDEVSDTMELDPEGLENTSRQLLTIQEDWKDWGRFRHSTTCAVAEYMKLYTRTE